MRYFPPTSTGSAASRRGSASSRSITAPGCARSSRSSRARAAARFEVAERLSWSRPWDQNRGFVRRSAIGETYAHLVYLERRGMIANDGADSGASADGKGAIDRWRLLGPAGAVTELIVG